MVVTVGLTVTEAVVEPPGFQVYVLAPLAVSAVEFPIQMPGVGLEIATVGKALTVMAAVVELVHTPLAPVSVYVVVTVGLTATVAVVAPPGLQV